MDKEKADICFLSNKIHLKRMRVMNRNKAWSGYLHSYIMLHELAMLKWQLYK